MPHGPETGTCRHPEPADTVQVLLGLYQENCEHGRHTENQRHLVTAMLLTAAGALLAVISTYSFRYQMWPLSLCVCVLGLLGLAFARVYEIKWEETGIRRAYYREKLQDIAHIKAMPNDYVPRHMPAGTSIADRPFSRLRLYWRATFLIVVVIGALATYVCLNQPKGPAINAREASATEAC